MYAVIRQVERYTVSGETPTSADGAAGDTVRRRALLI
jgi:hypothetical protein